MLFTLWIHECSPEERRSKQIALKGSGISKTGTRVTAIPVGQGILSFETMDEAVAAIREVVGHYARHAKTVREIVGAYFGSNKVLSRLIEE